MGIDDSASGWMIEAVCWMGGFPSETILSIWNPCFLTFHPSENRLFWNYFPEGRKNAKIWRFVNCWFSVGCKFLTNFSKANRRFQAPKSTISGFEIDDLLLSKSTVCSHQVVDLLVSSWRFTLSTTSSSSRKRSVLLFPRSIFAIFPAPKKVSVLTLRGHF